MAGPPGLPPASNLTPAGIGNWTEADLVRALREGKRPDGSSLDEFMPWKVFRGMTDAEIHAHLALPEERSSQAIRQQVEHGVRCQAGAAGSG